MIKLNSVIYNKLLLQAQEAKQQGMNKIASGILEAIGPYSQDEIETYAIGKLNEDIHRGLWKLATCVLKYHDVTSVNVEKIDEIIESFAEKLVDEIEISLEINGSRIGPLEPKLPGETK